MRRLPVLYRQEAGADLDNILIYLVEQRASGRIARGFVARIKARCQDIGDVPEGFPARSDLGPGIRLAQFERSAVISDEAVEIVRVLYGGRNYEAIMRGED
jgi:toxin ParE1/3/4